MPQLVDSACLRFHTKLFDALAYLYQQLSPQSSLSPVIVLESKRRFGLRRLLLNSCADTLPFHVHSCGTSRTLRRSRTLEGLTSNRAINGNWKEACGTFFGSRLTSLERTVSRGQCNRESEEPEIEE